MMNINEKIADIIAIVLKIDRDQMKQIAGNDSLNAIGMDSITCVGIVVEIEEAFNISFDDEELLLDYLNTINKLSKIVEQKMGLHSLT
ncbi:MAG TPA: acyl carrier protein [Bacilli bacterium]